MSIIDNITQLLSTQNKTQSDLAAYLGISKNCITDWKSGRIKSFTKYLPQIAEYFGVSVDYLLGKVEQAKSPVLMRTDIYPNITDMYSRLDEIDKAKVEAYMQGLLSAEKYSDRELKKKA